MAINFKYEIGNLITDRDGNLGKIVDIVLTKDSKWEVGVSNQTEYLYIVEVIKACAADKNFITKGDEFPLPTTVDSSNKVSLYYIDILKKL